MGFVDEVVVVARSGDGGKGCISFRRERFIPKGGPDGGDGGDGGDILIRATGKHQTLRYYSNRTYFRASNGQSGRGKDQKGKNGADVILETPPGTEVYDVDTGALLADLTKENQEILLIRGGKGGKGNHHFATATNRAPRIAQPGLPGEEKNIRFSLKCLADVGLVGLPNAGKSTLLSRLTKAQPKIDSYPFTTISPNLGVIAFDDGRTLTIADIPGLIKGASQGRGLGHRFLKHIERTGMLLHLLDVTYHPEQHILEDFVILRNELAQYNAALALKAQLVLINKIDLDSPDRRDIGELQGALGEIGLESLPISALKGDGLETLKGILAGRLLDD